MPRWDSSEAGAAGAENSVPDAPAEITALVKALPRTAADSQTAQQDAAYFRAHPDQLSYVRPYAKGELPPLLVLAHKGAEPVCVAVAYVCQGERVRVFLFAGMLHATGRVWAEKAARAERARLGKEARA